LTAAKTKIGDAPLTKSQGLDLYGAMLEIRYLEDEVQRLYTQGLIRGTTHLCQGQEAVAVGGCSVLRDGDTMTCTYRGHGAILAMGAPLDRTLAEIMGRETGLCRGKGGSMHLADLSVGALGSFAIVGAGLAVAAGAAWSAQYLGTGAVTLSFFGDGATNIGAFHEALNLAAIWSLPVVFVCENNLYGEYSPLKTTTPVDDLSTRAASYGMRGLRVDGNDLISVRTVVGQAVRVAREGNGPSFIEALTYRHSGHSRADPGKYRPQDEVDTWLSKDPIPRFAEVLKGQFGAAPEEIETRRMQAQAEVARAVEFAVGSPEPSSDALLEDVFV
jgi:acetoin:2,6-dichlorophenolindophenol oxidoreductase subunit alpha